VVEDLTPNSLRLTGPEARHLQRSLRLRPGEKFVATDGRGGVARLEVVAADRRGILAEVRERVSLVPPSPRFWLAGEAQGARSDWLVEKAAELGAWALVPLGSVGPGRPERWRRLSRAALKQSLGAYSMRIETGPAEDLARERPFAGIWLADPAGEPAG